MGFLIFLQEYLDHQRKMEEEQKERRDMERLEQLKKKEKHEQSKFVFTFGHLNQCYFILRLNCYKHKQSRFFLKKQSISPEL